MGIRGQGCAGWPRGIIVASGNFHGRTTTIVSFSDDPLAHDHFGPYTLGFVMVPYGDLGVIRDVITDHVVAVLLEPIQGESGVQIPPAGYLAGVRELTGKHRVLFIADEIQSGLGPTGRTLACEHEDVIAYVYLLGKALGGGIGPYLQSLLIMTCSACCSRASMAAPSEATHSPALSAWPLCGCSRPGNTKSEPPVSACGSASGWIA